MPIDVERAKAAALAPMERTYGPAEVILYHLGVGAGADPVDATELTYTYEGSLKVLPTFAVTLYSADMTGGIQIDGLAVDPVMMLHGEQELIVHRPLPAEAAVSGVPRILDVWDKGKAAVVVSEITSKDPAGNELCSSRTTMFARGEGGFGGSPGPKADPFTPTREPDLVIQSPTLPQQALLYRLTGDRNPLHADPAFAGMGGFPRPILHGLCSYGIVCKAVVDHVLDGDVSALRRYAARFAGIVFPGETIESSIWVEGDQVHVIASTVERGEPVLTNVIVEHLS